MSVQESAQNVSDTAIAIAKAVDASPIANDTLHDLITATSDAAQVAVAAGSKNPIAITSSAISVFTDLMKLGPEVVNAWTSFISLFHKKVATSSAGPNSSAIPASQTTNTTAPTEAPSIPEENPAESAPAS